MFPSTLPNKPIGTIPRYQPIDREFLAVELCGKSLKLAETTGIRGHAGARNHVSFYFAQQTNWDYPLYEGYIGRPLKTIESSPRQPEYGDMQVPVGIAGRKRGPRGEVSLVTCYC
jgi:hypothetical protein